MITFRSDAAADVMMFDDVARHMMQIMGKEFQNLETFSIRGELLLKFVIKLLVLSAQMGQD